MKKLLYISFFLLITAAASAQPHGNEWVNHTQRYLRISIITEGVYRVDSTTLATALASLSPAVPLSSIDPRSIQVFGRGEEQYIYVKGESDSVFNSADFIEFHAKPNDGYLDTLIYSNAPFSPNPYLSIFNDTAAYFITWNSSVSNRRLTIETDTNSSGYTPEPFFWKESILSVAHDYYYGETNGIGGTSPLYTKAEGWFEGPGSVIGFPSQDQSVLTLNPYTSGPDAQVEMVLTGQSENSSIADPQPDHHLQVEFRPSSSSPYTLLVDTFFRGYELLKFQRQVPASQLGTPGTLFHHVSVAEPGFNVARTAFSYIRLRYPHTPTLENNSTYKLVAEDDTQGKAYFFLTDFVTYGTSAFAYDLTNNKRIDAVSAGTNLEILIPNSGGEKACFLASDTSAIKIASLLPVNGTGYFFDYSAPKDSAFVIITHSKLMNEAQAYKQHRESITGGSHDVIIADVQDLYDQFAHGVNKNPLAIRRFCAFLLDTMPTEPQNLFLVGKSLPSSIYKKNAAEFGMILVPTFGVPGADMVYTMGLDNNPALVPAIPTGRLSASEPYHVSWYLEKVQQYDTTIAAEWMKNILHFSGGTTVNEQNAFQSYLASYEDTLENIHSGGNVVTFKKTSSAPIQINQSDSLRDLIENGVSLMTFFGHASGTGFDQSIDAPQNYNNLARYPFLVANSCYVGDIHTTSQSSSEEFVLIQNKGVIGYLASVSLGVPHALHAYSSEFFRNVARRSYGKSVGVSIKEAIKANESSSDENIQLTCMEMSLHGDPSVVINSHKQPDYEITNADVSFDLVSRPDSFAVFATVTNIGKAINDTIIIEFRRTLPNNETVISEIMVKAPLYETTYSVKFPVDFAKGLGLNKMRVKVDAFNDVSELSENNNVTGDIPFIIPGSDILPVYPYKYAVVPNNTVTLKASTGNPFASLRSYVFQVDTTDNFNSPQLQSTSISSPGGVVEWTPPITLLDSVVYFWRVSPDSIDSTGYQWKESSFQHIPFRRGWGQAHFFQFKDNEYQFVKHNRPGRTYDFIDDVKNLYVENFVYLSAPGKHWADVRYEINNTVMKNWSCAIPGITVVVFDSVSGKPGVTRDPGGNPTPAPYYNYVCFPDQDFYGYDFYDSDSTWQSRIGNLLESIPEGNHVLIYNVAHKYVSHQTSSYDNALYQAFDSIGSGNIRNIPDTVPYIIWGRKGWSPGMATEVIGTNRSSVITLSDTFSTHWNTGYIESELIGPAVSWGSLHWRYHSLETNSDDQVTLKVVGVRSSGAEDTLATLTAPTMDVFNLGSIVDSTLYPYIKLVAYEKDDTLRTPPYLDRWHVLYTPAPEAALEPELGYMFNDTIMQEGEELKLSIAVKNISEYAFTDSLLFTYWIVDKDRVINMLPSKLKKKPFSPGEVMLDTLTVSTEGFPGLNSIWMEVNPVGQQRSQLEQYHFNNIAKIDFLVSTDEVNPLLDVTFDGVHILNQDIVSAKPNILIQLKDENKYLALDDSSDFKVFIKTPSQTVAQQVAWGPQLTFIKAALPDNRCKVNYMPEFPQDGIYELIVQAKDKSHNQSGAIDYKIQFEVVNKSTITEVLNYPNPFSTSTRFVFTLTGSEVPVNFRIQVMTVTGKVVREIGEIELGPIHIGRNITEYAWDGKDQYGDQLANGVYLYRVLTELNGADIEKRATNADQYFTKGFGKMYLIR